MAKQSPQQDQRGLVQKFLDRLLLSWRLILDRRVEMTYKVIPPLALLYVISPIDFIPDIFLPFGVMDDLGVALLGLEVFIRMAPPEVVKEHFDIIRKRFSDFNMDQDAPPKRKNDEREDIIDGDYTVN